VAYEKLHIAEEERVRSFVRSSSVPQPKTKIISLLDVQSALCSIYRGYMPTDVNTKGYLLDYSNKL
jgi:hypothetical protein